MKIKTKVLVDKMVDKELFRSQGYIKVDILSNQEMENLNGSVHKINEEISSNRNINDEDGTWRINLFDKRILLNDIHPLIYHENLLRCMEHLLGEDLVFEGGVLLLAKPKNKYKQGWHRDVWQIPEEQIADGLFSPDVHHNCIQVNLALSYDESFWIVPGSHNRPNKDDENKLFNGSKHLTSVDVDMPNAVSVPIEPGQAILYNNNAIHRGFNKNEIKRATFHASYHSSKFPPSWHFYNSGFSELSLDDIQDFPFVLQEMWKKNRLRRNLYPEISNSWKL